METIIKFSDMKTDTEKNSFTAGRYAFYYGDGNTRFFNPGNRKIYGAAWRAYNAGWDYEFAIKHNLISEMD